MRKGCRFVHFDPERAYPTGTDRRNNQRNYRDNQAVGSRPSPRHKTNNRHTTVGQVITTDRNQVKGATIIMCNYNVCYKFQNTGSCPYGNRCKFRHIQQYKHNVTNTNNMNVTNDQMYSFLGEMRTPVDSVKTTVEFHRHVGPTVAFTGYPPQTQQPCQHVAQEQTIFPGPIGI